MDGKEFEVKLRSFYLLLQKERKVLIKGHAEKLTDIVARKEKFIPLFQEYQGDLSDSAKDIIAKIKEQQEENLLLTQQAMSFQDMLLDTIKDNIKKVNHVTYGKESSYHTQAPSTLIDTEV